MTEWIREHKSQSVALGIIILIVLILIVVLTGRSATATEENESGVVTSAEREQSRRESSAIQKENAAKPEESIIISEESAEEQSAPEAQTESVTALTEETESSSPGADIEEEPASTPEAAEQPADGQEETPPAASNSAEAEKPVHTHVWQNHYAQRWVSNWVTVVDTPEQTVYGAQLYTEQADGTWISNGEIYWFENGYTMDDFKSMLADLIKNGYMGNYVNRTKTIPAVTHEEDQGWYEEYIDYQYCSCGETRSPQ